VVYLQDLDPTEGVAKLIDFTTYDRRRKMMPGACFTLGRHDEKTVELYLDEIAKLTEEAVKRIPRLDFEFIFFEILQRTILHELLHKYGANDERFIARATAWARELKSKGVGRIHKVSR